MRMDNSVKVESMSESEGGVGEFDLEPSNDAMMMAPDQIPLMLVWRV